jgi:hypothetical protein
MVLSNVRLPEAIERIDDFADEIAETHRRSAAGRRRVDTRRGGRGRRHGRHVLDRIGMDGQKITYDHIRLEANGVGVGADEGAAKDA